jgi:hypothetical protein
MSVHQSDRQLLSELIHLGETVLSHPLAAMRSFIAHAHEVDALAASARLGAGETILLTALQKIVTGGAASQAELARLGFIAQQALSIVRDHYFALVEADARRVQP